MGEHQNLFVALSKEALQEIIMEAAEKGAESAVKKMAKEEKANKKKRQDRRIHNTRLLLRNYRSLKDGVKNAVYEKTEDIENILDDIESTDQDESLHM